MKQIYINPFYDVIINCDKEINIINKVSNRILFKGISEKSNGVEQQEKVLLKKIEKLFSKHLIVTKQEYQFLLDLKKYVDDIDNSIKEDVKFSHLFDDWLFSTQLDKVEILDGEVQVKRLLSNDNATYQEAILEINLETDLDYNKLLLTLKHYKYVYICSVGDFTAVGPFLEQSHLKIENFFEIFTNQEIDESFIDSSLEAGVKQFVNNLVYNMLVERISNFLLAQSPFYNRKIYIKSNNRIELGEELALV